MSTVVSHKMAITTIDAPIPLGGLDSPSRHCKWGQRNHTTIFVHPGELRTLSYVRSWVSSYNSANFHAKSRYGYGGLGYGGYGYGGLGYGGYGIGNGGYGYGGLGGYGSFGYGYDAYL
ncbi:hypothetical protein AVEN_128005-1 [Araneus ventricosus]|uniref:Uncharacterized protein n=1 Tax=Araneus ventricosus TaxID=182803 RepID=A0A4Y1ZZ46_ARAVE|nr:hypothetical protein AVEN_128005-1 [Araneus ventricosus]